MPEAPEPTPPPFIRSGTVVTRQNAPPTEPDADLLADFIPNCPDCRYDLAGSPDGRCPECGLGFTHAGLRRLWVAKKLARREKGLLAGKVVATFVPVFLGCLFPLGTAWGFVAAMAWWTTIAGFFAWRNRDWLLAHSYALLVFLLPLLLMMSVAAATPFGRVACAIIGVLSLVICWAALRGSPLISGVVILLLVSGPILLIALFMYVEATDTMNRGHYWSNFDQPTPHGWQALPCTASRSIAKWIALVGLAIAAMVLLYSRRAWVRWRAARAA